MKAYWPRHRAAVLDVSVAPHVDAPAVQSLPARGGARWHRDSTGSRMAALASRLLGSASLPVTLWLVVFGAAGLSWALAEGISRVVWRQKGHW